MGRIVEGVQGKLRWSNSLGNDDMNSSSELTLTFDDMVCKLLISLLLILKWSSLLSSLTFFSELCQSSSLNSGSESVLSVFESDSVVPFSVIWFGWCLTKIWQWWWCGRESLACSFGLNHTIFCYFFKVFSLRFYLHFQSLLNLYFSPPQKSQKHTHTHTNSFNQVLNVI